MSGNERTSNLLRAQPARSRGRKKTAKSGRSPVSARRTAVFLLLALLVAVGSIGYFASARSNLVAAGVSIASLDVGGKTQAVVRDELTRAVSGLKLAFESADGARLVLPAVQSVNAGGQPLASFDVDAAVAMAAGIGREPDAFKAAMERLDAYFFGRVVSLPARLDEAALRAALAEKFGSSVEPAENARLVINFGSGGRPLVTVSPEKNGVAVDFDYVIKGTADRLKNLSAEPVTVRVRQDRPELVAADVTPLVASAVTALTRVPFTFRAKDLSWEATAAQIADWLVAAPGGQPGAPARLDLDQEKFSRYLEGRTANLAVPPVDAAFEMKDGKVTVFRPSTDGEGVDVEAGLGLMRAALFSDQPPAAALEMPFTKIAPKTDTEHANPYGLKEIIGIGESNFKGSPANRRHNIQVGAQSVNGTLIMPDEEFSLLKTLGTIDDTKGYLKELVIKKDKTTPEYGGGLCQIGTTTFRATLASGLPITERRNHSYRVSYYERDGSGKMMGPGKDATIYDPWPDFKFKNDTGHVILIQTAIAGDRLTFTFWGVNDGRRAEQTVAVVSNIVPPPEKKIIETADLKPGVTKCTESPHAGADAVFTYTVTYASGEVKKNNFYSHYQPWGEVCLIGIDPNAPPAASSQPALPSADVVGASGQ